MIEHKDLSEKTVIRPKKDPYQVTSEPLLGDQTELASFFFNLGANFYVFSYPKDGLRRHTLIDTGDPIYRDRILSLLTDHRINPEHIERIIITHRHHDHCGLADLLAQKSGAKILVHANFRQFIEGPLSEMDRMWLRGFDPSRLRQCRVEYLSPLGGNHSKTINGLNFPLLSEPIPIGDKGRLEIMACPDSGTMHSPDQIIVHYVPQHPEGMEGQKPDRERQADHILFSGDLWLMHGPLFSKSFRTLSLRLRMASRQMKGVLSGQKSVRRDPRLQDIQAKEALKHGFGLVRVMPGHGEDFIGTRMVPLCFLCDRDLLVELGYSMDEKKSILKTPELAEKIKTLKGNAYVRFIEELGVWRSMGYNSLEISDFLTRIYLEQEGGGPLVKEDRRERRQRIKEMLTRLALGRHGDNTLKELAEASLFRINKIS